LDSLFELID